MKKNNILLDIEQAAQQQRNATLYAFAFLARMCVALNELNLSSEPCFNIALPDNVSVAVAFVM